VAKLVRPSPQPGVRLEPPTLDNRAATAEPVPDKAGLSRQVRSLIAFAALDVMLGSWLALHAEWLPGVLTAHVVSLGIFGFVWRFVEEPLKKPIGQTLSALLVSPRTPRILWLVTGALFVLTLFVSSVRVSARDATSPITVARVNDAGAGDARAALASAVSRRIDRDNNPVSYLTQITPFGRRVWFNTSTMLHSRPMVVRPWFRHTLEYPEDFERNATIVVLPAGTLLDVFMSASPPSLIARRGAEVMARGAVDRLRGIVLSFVEPASPDSSDQRRWRDSLLAHGADSASARTLTDMFAKAQWLQTDHPLTPNDTIVLELVSGHGPDQRPPTNWLAPRIVAAGVGRSRRHDAQNQARGIRKRIRANRDRFGAPTRHAAPPVVCECERAHIGPRRFRDIAPGVPARR
jgi:hypothetical protein